VTIQELGSIGELIAAVATIATLGYLALQIRASVGSTRAEARRTMDVVGLDAVSRIAENPELAGLFMRGLGEPEALSPEEWFRFTLSLSVFFSMHETAWAETQGGTIGLGELEKMFDRLKPFALSPGGRMWWQQRSGMYQREFRDYFESRLASIE
jgi:hypothetical protein